MVNVTWSIQHRRDTAANWTSANTLLLAGQIGYETDTDRFKIGDGVTLWNNNPKYFIDLQSVQLLLNTVIRDRGNFDASFGTFPTTGGSGESGAIQLGNQWTISVGGTLGGEEVDAPYDIIRALVDNPQDVRSDWYIQHASSPVVNPSMTTITKIITASTITPFVYTENNLYIVTALNSNATITTPSGSISQGVKLTLRIKDNGTSRNLAFTSYYRFPIDFPAPPTTRPGQTLYADFIFNAEDTVLDCVSINYENDVVQKTGTATTFDKDANYGTPTSPVTGNITASYTAARLGVAILIIHKAGSAPTYPAEFEAVSSSGSYVINVNNYIYCEFLSASLVKYSICQ